MAILLTILKWVGIALLVILIALLGILAYCLFLPMGYGIKASHQAGGEYQFFVRAWGFLHFWQIAMMEIDGEYQLAIFAFWGKLRLYPSKMKQESTSQPSFEETAQSILDDEDISDILCEKEVNLDDLPPKQEAIKEQKHEKRNSSKVKEKTSTIKESKASWNKFHNKFKDAHNKKAVEFFLQKILWLIKKTKPNILHADVEFSLGDPALTGLSTGVISLCPGAYGKKTKIYPDFESDDIYMNGWIEIKGIVFFVHIVYLIISIFFNKDCRRLMQS